MYGWRVVETFTTQETKVDGSRNRFLSQLLINIIITNNHKAEKMILLFPSATLYPSRGSRHIEFIALQPIRRRPALSQNILRFP